MKDVKSAPLVSVMIPCFNQREYIGAAIDSVLAQSYPNVEIVVSDDASTDGTEAIMGRWSYDEKIKYYRNKVNIGRIANYSTTLKERVSGKYVLNLDGDDVLLCNNFIEVAVQIMEQYKLSLVFGKRVRLGENYNCKMGGLKIFNGDFLSCYIEDNISMPHLGTLYNRETALNLDFYSVDIISADRHSMLNLAYDNKIGYINLIAGGWRNTGRNISRETDVQKRIANVSLPYLVVNTIAKRIHSDKALIKWSHRYAGHISANYIAMYLKMRQYRAGFAFLVGVVRKYPFPLLYYGAKRLVGMIVSKRYRVRSVN